MDNTSIGTWRKNRFCSSDGCLVMGAFEKSTFSSNPSGCLEVGGFRKASFSNPSGNCLEAGGFRKATFSAVSDACVAAGSFAKPTFSHNGGSCVEVGAFRKPSGSGPTGGQSRFGPPWGMEVSAALYVSEEYNEQAPDQEHIIAVRDSKDVSIPPLVFSLEGWKRFLARVNAGQFPLMEDKTVEYHVGYLVYNHDEWDAFLKGAREGEFDLTPELEAELARTSPV